LIHCMTTVHVYHDSQPIYEETFNTTDQANLGTPAKKELHVYLKNFKVAGYINGIIRYQLLDHLGSTRVETDAAGKPVTLVNYGTFGRAEGENEYETNRINGDFEAGTAAPAKWVRAEWSGETLKDSANALWL
jgi:hypothetical protein